MMRDFWKDRRVFVTGAAGFIGSRLVKKLLEQKAVVIALIQEPIESCKLLSSIKKKIRVVQGDLENFRLLDQTLAKFHVETVFHLGAQTQVGRALLKPLETFESNIRGSYNLLEACRLNQNQVKRIIVASSDKAYGESDSLPYLETMALSGSFPYDVSKSCADLLAKSYHTTYKLPIGIARCGNVFGGGDLNWDRLIPGVIQSLFNNNSPELRSDGSFLRDFIYIDDVIEAYLTLAEHLDQKDLHGEAFNFSLESPQTVISIVKKLIDFMEKKDLLLKIHDNCVAEIKDQYLSCQKAKQLLSWYPKIFLEEGLKRTILWYQNYFLEKQIQEIIQPVPADVMEVS